MMRKNHVVLACAGIAVLALQLSSPVFAEQRLAHPLRVAIDDGNDHSQHFVALSGGPSPLAQAVAIVAPTDPALAANRSAMNSLSMSSLPVSTLERLRSIAARSARTDSTVTVHSVLALDSVAQRQIRLALARAGNNADVVFIDDEKSVDCGTHNLREAPEQARYPNPLSRKR